MALPAVNPKGLVVSEILPPKAPMLRSTVSLPVAQWERLREIVEVTKEQDPNGAGYTRDEIISHFLAWAFQKWEEEQSQGKRGRR